MTHGCCLFAMATLFTERFATMTRPQGGDRVHTSRQRQTPAWRCRHIVALALNVARGQANGRRLDEVDATDTGRHKFLVLRWDYFDRSLIHHNHWILVQD